MPASSWSCSASPSPEPGRRPTPSFLDGVESYAYVPRRRPAAHQCAPGQERLCHRNPTPSEEWRPPPDRSTTMQYVSWSNSVTKHRPADTGTRHHRHRSIRSRRPGGMRERAQRDALRRAGDPANGMEGARSGIRVRNRSGRDPARPSVEPLESRSRTVRRPGDIRPRVATGRAHLERTRSHLHWLPSRPTASTARRADQVARGHRCDVPGTRGALRNRPADRTLTTSNANDERDATRRPRNAAHQGGAPAGRAAEPRSNVASRPASDMNPVAWTLRGCSSGSSASTSRASSRLRTQSQSARHRGPRRHSGTERRP